MKLKWIGFLILMVALVVGVYYLFYWVNTQPIKVVTGQKVGEEILRSLPKKNRELIKFIENNGKSIAPTYDEVACTEFMIQTIKHFTPLSFVEENKIRIITDKDLIQLISEDSSVIKGVQNALVNPDKGILVEHKDAMPGDLVQFWNVFNHKAYGHCGVVMEAAPGNNKLVVYSSHPFTKGYGIQEFFWPDKAYFVRLK